MLKTIDQPALESGNFDCLTGALLWRRAACRRRRFAASRTNQKIWFAEVLFTPCTPVGSLLEALPEAAKCASRGDAVLLSPACSSFDRFRNDQQRGKVLCTVVESISRGLPGGNPNGNGNGRSGLLSGSVRPNRNRICPQVF